MTARTPTDSFCFICLHIHLTMSNPKGMITVLYFAAASTTTGATSEEVPLPHDGLKLSELVELLVSRHPNTDLGPILNTSRWSVDCEMVDDPETVLLKGGEEVGVICPVSGG
ncbi:hypothetical protein BDZ97DRAFT_1092673 [Flammula alnicola]|nr:hypothetical protein BDZ97DRAFT_1092673 [Flammula alnicola]